jgi:hypothetical protein
MLKRMIDDKWGGVSPLFYYVMLAILFLTKTTECEYNNAITALITFNFFIYPLDFSYDF